MALQEMFVANVGILRHLTTGSISMNKPLKTLLWTGASAAAVAAAGNAVFANAEALTNTLGGEGRFWPGPYGDVFYARQGKGTPIVLLHGIYAGASGWEWRKNFDALSEHYEVYAPDWLGFGLSDKPRIRYTADKYLEMLSQFLTDVVRQPAVLVASSLAAAYAVQVAQEKPGLVDGLVLVCPTGLRELASPPNLGSEAAYQTLHAPLLGTALYNTIASQVSLRWYLSNMTYFDPTLVDDAMVAHYSAATHQYGSQNALPSFMSGLLNHSVADAFPKLTQQPLRLVWGRESRVTPLSDAEAFLAANPHAELSVLDRSGIVPHDEQAQAFNKLVVETLSQAPSAATPHPF